MEGVAVFEKVSYEIFEESCRKCFPDLSCDLPTVYRNIRLPGRATKGSAGYDFYSTVTTTLAPSAQILIPTGIRCRMREDYALFIFPRSGLGFRYRLQLNNTVGIIDSDYYYSDNEGHIMIKLTNDSKDGRDLLLEEGQGFAQGIFLSYGITEDDSAGAVRNGGFGSTDK